MKTKMTIKNQKGAAIVEFAIVLPLLILFAFGICEFGLMWYNTQVITNASREGARAGIVREGGPDFLTAGELKQLVVDYCDQRLIDFGGTTVTLGDVDIDPSNDTLRALGDFGSDFSVTVTYNYTSLFGAGPHLTLQRKTLMKLENLEII